MNAALSADAFSLLLSQIVWSDMATCEEGVLQVSLC